MEDEYNYHCVIDRKTIPGVLLARPTVSEEELARLRVSLKGMQGMGGYPPAVDASAQILKRIEELKKIVSRLTPMEML